MSLINGSGLVPLAQTVNDTLMFGWFGPLLLMSIFSIAFISFQQTTNDGWRSFSWALTIAAVLSLPIRAMGLSTDAPVYITWIVLGISMLFLFAKEKG